MARKARPVSLENRARHLVLELAKAKKKLRLYDEIFAELKMDLWSSQAAECWAKKVVALIAKGIDEDQDAALIAALTKQVLAYTYGVHPRDK